MLVNPVWMAKLKP